MKIGRDEGEFHEHSLEALLASVNDDEVILPSGLYQLIVY
jgi:hypothetical protein